METVTGRPKGTANLSDEIKLGILQQKKLQIVPQHTIAQDFGVSRKTVNQMTEDKLSPQAKIKLDSFVEKLGQAREKVIQRINEKLDNNDFKDGVYPNLLNAINNNYRLETNQPTAIINEAATDKVAQAFSNLLKRKREQGLILSDSELITLIEAACVQNQADIEQVKARVLAPVESTNLDHNQGIS